MKAKWRPHYTGIEILEQGNRNKLFNWDLYRQRDKRSQVLEFIRLSWKVWPMRYSSSTGIFLRRTNYGGGAPGWEVFISRIHFGWFAAKSRWPNDYNVHWSGSSVQPHAHYSIGIGRFFIGSDAEIWLQRLMTRKSVHDWNQMMADYERQWLDAEARDE